MDLNNYTPYPALLSRFVVDPERDLMGSALVARVTYDVVGNGLVPSKEQTWKVSPQPWECPYGAMEADDAFYKGATDIFLFGRARSPGKRPVSAMNVVIQVGAFRRQIIVLGDRVWLAGRTKNTLVAGPPQRFFEMPLTLDRAFGGAAEWDGLKVPFADNPSGKGFYLELEQAEGHQLPNLEDPQHLVQRWDERPSPVGLAVCPMCHSGRIKNGTEFDEEGILVKLDARFFNAAFPEMLAYDVKPGVPVRIDGVLHEGSLQFSVPAIPVVFKLTLDSTPILGRPAIDQIGIEADLRRVFVTYRYPFRYVLFPRQRRTAELLLAGG
jgi:hypothetical protein